MVALHLLTKSRRDVTCLFFNHGTKFSDDSENFLSDLDIDLICGRISEEMPKGVSMEHWWRDQRYGFFDSFADRPVITCHHLDDQIETMLMSFCQGKLGRTIPYKRGNYLRPFIYASRREIEAYAKRNKVQFLNDPSNSDVRFTRNRVRKNVIPELLKVNPGLYKTMARMIKL